MAGRGGNTDRWITGVTGTGAAVAVATAVNTLTVEKVATTPAAIVVFFAVSAVSALLLHLALRGYTRRSNHEFDYLSHIQERSLPFGPGGETLGPEHSPRSEPLPPMNVAEAGRAGHRPLTYYLRAPEPVVLTLVGGPGTGKTSVLKQLAAETTRNPSRGLPVLLRLPDCGTAITAEPRSTLVDIVRISVSEDGDKGRSWDRWFERRLRKGRCLVLLDALDEVDPARQPLVSAWITAQVRHYPRNDFLITSRSLPTPWPRDFGGAILTVRPPTDAQLSAYLERRLPDVDQRALLARWSLSELADNRTLLSALLRNYDKSRRIPGSPAVLYGELLQRLLDDAQRAQGPSFGSSPTGKLRVIRVLALEMAELDVDRAPEAVCVRLIEQILRKTVPLRPGEFLRLLVEDGILVERLPGEFAFAYRGFRDYLAAEQIRSQGSVRLLVDHMRDPGWRDIILAWAASTDASPFIEACLRHSREDVLRLARECAEVSPQVEPELRAQLSRSFRQARPGPGPGPSVPVDALTAYVEKLHSVPARRLLQRARREDRPVSREEATSLLVRARSRAVHESTGADADAFFSAAVLATERADHRAAQTYRFQGLAALSHAVRGESLASSRDLAIAALRLLDPDEPDPTHLRTACLAYLGSPADPRSPDAFKAAVWSACREAEGHACKLLVPLIATHRRAAQLVIGTLSGDTDLLHAVADVLGTDPPGAGSVTGWDTAVDSWLRTRRDLVYELGALAHLEAKPEPLRDARELVADRLKDPGPPVAGLDGLGRALDRLADYVRLARFDARDAALRAAARQAELVRATVRAAPTELAVELSEPTAVRIEELVQEAQLGLVRDFPPRPLIGLTLPAARIVGRTVTVLVELENEDEHSAPLEGAALTASGDPAVVVPAADAWTEPAASLPGGTATTVPLRLELAGVAEEPGEFEVRVTLRYRPRNTTEPVLRQASLTVALDRSHRPIDPNPYAGGNTGRPLREPDMLFGRDELIEKMRETLRVASTPGTGIALFGQQRTGKSSIGVELARQLGTSDGLPVVYIENLGALAPRRRSGADQAEVLGTLLWRIVEGAQETAPAGTRLVPEGFDRKTLIESPDPVGDCARIFRTYRAAVPESPPWVVIIDEFQYMDVWTRQGRVLASFMQTFKAIIECRLFHMVLLGQSRVERLVEEDPNAFGVFGLERVTCLAEADARALIVEPILLKTPHGPVSRHHERAVTEIIRLTGGNPFYTQKICYELVRHLNRERATTATDSDVRHVTQLLLANPGRNFFHGLESPDAGDERWTAAQLKSATRAVAWACAGGSASPERIHHCHEGELPPGILDHLVSRETLRHVGDRYEFVVGLFEE
ncbi:hypothetical protein [Streptomyces sp. NPDC097619]|uniref:hypothetical protein n=1 Tax=Streptomyces sp. NPDC097619 TaxID=3157228 RepID=UPI00331ED836